MIWWEIEDRNKINRKYISVIIFHIVEGYKGYTPMIPISQMTNVVTNYVDRSNI